MPKSVVFIFAALVVLAVTLYFERGIGTSTEEFQLPEPSMVDQTVQYRHSWDGNRLQVTRSKPGDIEPEVFTFPPDSLRQLFRDNRFPIDGKMFLPFLVDQSLQDDGHYVTTSTGADGVLLYRLHLSKKLYFDFPYIRSDLAGSPQYRLVLKTLREQWDLELTEEALFDYLTISAVTSSLEVINWDIDQDMDRVYEIEYLTQPESADFHVFMLGRQVWIPSRLYHCDGVTRTCTLLKWFGFRELAQAGFADLDQDGQNEIVLTTQRHYPYLPVFSFSKNIPFNPGFCHFLALNPDGTVKTINNTPMHFFHRAAESGKWHFDPHKRLVYIGYSSRESFRWENMTVVNTRNGYLKDLGIRYIDILDFFFENEQTGFIRTVGEKMWEKVVLDDSLHQHIQWRKYLPYKFEEWYGNIVEVGGRRLSVFDPPFLLVDEDGSQVYLNESARFKGKHRDGLLLEKSDGSSGETIFLSFHPKVRFTPTFWITTGVVVLLLTILLIYHLWISVPLEVGNYLIVQRWFGFLYVCRLQGRISRVMPLPHRFYFSRETLQSMLSSFKDDLKLIVNRIAFPASLKIYRIESDNDLLVVQELAHELKNRLVGLKLKHQAQSDEMENHIEACQVTSRMLLHLSRIRSLKLEQVSPMKLVIDLLGRMTSHPRFHTIALQEDTERKMVEGDVSLLLSAFENLILNALEAVPADGTFAVSGKASDDGVEVCLRNTFDQPPDREKVGTLGYSSKQTGNGCGLVLTRKIIEHHHGLMTIDITEREFIVTVFLPYTINEGVDKHV